MHLSTSALLAAATILPTTLAQATFQRSSKRGLVFVPSVNFPQDNQIWVEPGSDLTWYYNYSPSPSSAYSNLIQSKFEFVPMLFSASNTFEASIESLISGGTNISHVLTYNEPDGSSSTGGSAMTPSDAATNWISQVEPLRELGIKTGAPAVTGSPGGFTWLSEFFSNCTSKGTSCTADFIPIHWYGNFEGLASHLGQVVGTYPNTPIWVTEYALSNDTLSDTQSFFNTSAEYFDRLTYVERYSYFGAFRSPVSNVGPNAAMLDGEGQLTDIGSWYLGGAATNNIPTENLAAKPVAGGMWGALVAVGMVFFVL